METRWDERREFEGRLFDGRGITAHEAQRLIDDADSAERTEAILTGLKRILKSELGLMVLETTTDDDEETRIDLVRAEENEGVEESVIQEGERAGH